MTLTVHQSIVDPSIYRLAEEFADYVRAHAIIESNEIVVAVGDAGQAWGLLQMHPAFILDYGKFAGISVHDTWAEAEVRICAAFYRLQPGKAIDLLVQAYNLGVKAVFDDGQRNPTYLQRWGEAYQRIRSKPRP